MFLKMTVFWDVAPYSHHHPDDGGSNNLWNVGKFLPDYTAKHLRKQ
jgi:hypothetical protein